jgi:hypothetical protein
MISKCLLSIADENAFNITFKFLAVLCHRLFWIQHWLVWLLLWPKILNGQNYVLESASKWMHNGSSTQLVNSGYIHYIKKCFQNAFLSWLCMLCWSGICLMDIQNAVSIASQQHKSCNAQLLTKAYHLQTKA